MLLRLDFKLVLIGVPPPPPPTATTVGDLSPGWQCVGANGVYWIDAWELQAWVFGRG